MSSYITFAVTLLTIVNPIGSLALFTGIAGDRPLGEQKTIARTAGLAVAVILVVVTWTGAGILAFFGVTPAGLQAAGGTILILLGLSMLRSETPRIKATRKERVDAHDRESIAIVPLAIPITAGPGAITTVILATQDLPTATDRAVLSAIGILTGLLIWLCFHFAAPIANKLGVTGVRVVTRIMGLLLTAIAFQMLANGLRQLLPGLG